MSLRASLILYITRLFPVTWKTLNLRIRECFRPRVWPSICWCWRSYLTTSSCTSLQIRRNKCSASLPEGVISWEIKRDRCLEGGWRLGIFLASSLPPANGPSFIVPRLSPYPPSHHCLSISDLCCSTQRDSQHSLNSLPSSGEVHPDRNTRPQCLSSLVASLQVSTTATPYLSG